MRAGRCSAQQVQSDALQVCEPAVAIVLISMPRVLLGKRIERKGRHVRAISLGPLPHVEARVAQLDGEKRQQLERRSTRSREPVRVVLKKDDRD